MSTSHKIKIEINDIENNVYYKNNPQYFLELKELVENNPKKYSCLLKIGKKYKALNVWLNILLPLLQNNNYKYSTKCWWIFNNIQKFPKCKFCQNPFKNINVRNIKFGYSHYYSYKCMCKDPDYWTYYKACIQNKYGKNITNVFQLQKTKNKIKQTSLKLYGIESPNATEQAKKKKCQTNINKYGVPYVMQSLEFQKKYKKTMIELYGADNPMKIDIFKNKAKQTNIDKYNAPYIMQVKQFKEKSKQCCLEKYNVEHVLQNHDILKKARSKYFYNNLYFASKPEIAFYIWLKDNNVQFEYQPNILFKYSINNNIKYYQPDFIVNSDYIELKGDQFFKKDGTMQNPYDHSQDEIYEAKHQCMIKNNVKILRYEQYKKYLDYIAEKYGSKYLDNFKKV